MAVEMGNASLTCTRLFLAVLLFAGTGAEAQQASPDPYIRHITPGARVFIEKMDGFEDYLMAALQAKQVPVTVVTDKDKADFFISGHAKSSFQDEHHVEATIKAVNKEGDVVFAYAFDVSYTIHGKQSAAEACAKSLKKEITGHN